MSLTPLELEVLRTHLKHQERWLVSWSWWRWIVLFLAIVQIAAAVHSYSRMESFSDATTFSALGADNSQFTQVIDSAIEVRTDLLRKEMRMYVGVIVTGSLGLSLLCFCVLSWRKPVRIEVQYLLLKQELERHGGSAVDT